MAVLSKDRDINRLATFVRILQTGLWSFNHFEAP
jgi:hypothetical protein